MAEHVIFFAGPMGAGKTTAIESLSEIQVVRTEANNSERHIVDKATTTVALDYGETHRGRREGPALRHPGAARFDFMWAILKKRAKGTLLLVNSDAPDPIGEMIFFLYEFRELYDRGGVVVGLTRATSRPGPSLTDFSDALERTNPGLLILVFTADPREGDQCRMFCSSHR